MKKETVIAIYRPKPGRDNELTSIISRHVPVLRQEGLISDRMPIVLRSKLDGTYLEIFEWLSAEHAERAHNNASVREIWQQLREAADFLKLGDLKEAQLTFPHFESV
jgi:uncharacterized protein (DUF2249 family)